MELRNPFGLRDGQIVMIEDIQKTENGLNCKCFCPACNEPFIARMGDRKRHHFAHSGQGCDEINAYMTGMYMLLKEYLDKHNFIYVPPVIALVEVSAHSYLNYNNVESNVKLKSWSFDSKREIKLYDGKPMSFDSAEIISDSKNKPQVILVTKNVKEKIHTLALKIIPPDTVCKTGEATRYKDYPTLEIDLSTEEEFFQISQKQQIFERLQNDKSIYSWVYNPKIKEAYQQAIQLSKDYYDNAQLLIKQQREEQRKREEQERLEAERRAKAAAERIKREEAARKEHEEKQRLRLKEIQENPLLFIQQETKVRDLDGNRWIKCEECGAVKLDTQFSIYGGEGKINLGTCTECSRRSK